MIPVTNTLYSKNPLQKLSVFGLIIDVLLPGVNWSEQV